MLWCIRLTSGHSKCRVGLHYRLILGPFFWERHHTNHTIWQPWIHPLTCKLQQLATTCAHVYMVLGIFSPEFEHWATYPLQKVKGMRIPLLDPNFCSEGIESIMDRWFLPSKQAWYSLVHVLRGNLWGCNWWRDVILELQIGHSNYVWRSSKHNTCKCEWQRVVERLVLWMCVQRKEYTGKYRWM